MSQLPGWLWPASNILPPVYKKIWDAVQEDLNTRLGAAHGEVLVDTNKIFPLLLTSQLPTEVLGYIWSLANQKYAGQLTEQELYIVLALVALAQASYPFNSLEVLGHIRVPPTPNLNLALLDAVSVKSDAKHHQAPVQTLLSSSTAHKKPTNLVRPTSLKSNSLLPNLDGSQHHNDNEMRDQRLSATSSPQDVPNVSLLDVRQISHGQLESRHQSSSIPTESNDDFCDFQSAPVPNVSIIPNLWDSKQGSAIGSRLANHNLGVKKVNDRVKKNGSNRSINNNQTRGTVIPSSTRESQPTDHSPELFPKCIMKNQTKTVILKDTAIRSEPLELIKPVTKESLNVAEKVENRDGSMRPVGSLNTEPIDYALVKEEKNMQQDLMSLQPSEDKYSALRALVEEQIAISPSHTNLEPNNASCSPVTDDFGDFISAEQTQPSSHVSQTSEDTNVSNSIDLLSDFDFPAESVIGSNSKSSPSLVQEISDAFNALAFGEKVEREINETSEISPSTVEKIIQNEDTLSTNKIEMGTGAPQPLIRSGSVSSLDLKSFLPPPYDDDQQIENMHQMIYWEWKQYMESCVLLLQIAAKIFTSISSDMVLNEVLSSAQGYNFLVNLAEVAAVCRRVNFSHKEMDINIMGFDDLLLNIDRIWSEMEPFYTNIPIVTELPAWPLHQGDITCALCLTIITSGRVLYNSHSYHATCANLWLHAVNNNLPALRYPNLHLHSTILQNSNHV